MAKTGNGARGTSARKVRELARAERAAAVAAAKRRRAITTVVIAVVVIAVVGAIAGLVALEQNRGDPNARAPKGVVAPPGGAASTPGATTRPAPSASTGTAADQSTVAPETNKQSHSTAAGMGWGVGVGNANAKATLELFEDFSCPHCEALENSLGSQVKQAVDAGTLRVIYYPMTLPGFGKPTELAANAFACAADAGKAEAYHDALYANYAQAAQQWSNSFLTDIGTGVGLGNSFGNCVRKGQFGEWVKSIDDTGDARSVAGTPTAFVNGKLVPSADMSAEGIMADVSKVE